ALGLDEVRAVQQRCLGARGYPEVDLEEERFGVDLQWSPRLDELLPLPAVAGRNAQQSLALQRPQGLRRGTGGTLDVLGNRLAEVFEHLGVEVLDGLVDARFAQLAVQSLHRAVDGLSAACDLQSSPR